MKSLTLLLAPIAIAVGFAVVALTGDADVDAAPGEVSGAELYATQCAGCHGADGDGVTDRGPSLASEGPASVDFVLRTGRMPLADPWVQATRGPVRYSEEEIVALVEYAGALGDGPDIPDVDWTAGDLATGGEIYRLNCAACHVASGAGAAIGASRYAPSLAEATPTQVGQAILIGPGAMPSFSLLTGEEINDVARYVRELQLGDATAVTEFGGAGPVAEGLAAWLLGLLPLIALTRWIGSPHEGRDTGAVQTADEQDLGQ